MCALHDNEDLEQRRRSAYNATVLEIVEVHSDLRILRVQPDGPIPSLKAGQYTSLGLGNWEPRLPDTQAEPSRETHRPQVLKRAYSLSCTMLDATGQIRSAARWPYLEFYIALVRETQIDPPAFTPRLFALVEGSRLFLGSKITGHYTLAGVQPADDVIFFATGTGEAPHNAMLAELLEGAHRGRIVSVVSVRYRRDLGYLATHRAVEQQFPNYRYVPLTTREPENLDPSLPAYIGKHRLQQYVRSGNFERDAQLLLEPQRTHVFLCGNPEMIGAPRKLNRNEESPGEPGGMVEILQQRGFRVSAPHRPGNLHFEKYW